MTDREIIQFLTLDKKKMEKALRESERRLQKAPEGTVFAHRHGKGYQFYMLEIPGNKKRIYLPASERAKAAALMQKRYDHRIVTEANRQLSVINRFLKGFKPDPFKDIYRSLSEIRREMIEPYEISDEEYIARWQACEYQGKEFRDDMPEQYTSKGERVRSKSEVMIADALAQAGIPYRYEYPLELDGIIYYPDFTILRVSDLQEMRWEHFGMMEDSEYSREAIRKIRTYERNGMFPGINMIYTMESETWPLNMAVIRRTIEAYLK